MRIGVLALGLSLPALACADPPQRDPNSWVIPQLTLPDSSFLTAETTAALRAERAREAQEAPPACGELQKATAAAAPAIRRCEWEAFYQSPFFKRLHARYAVTMKPQTMAGVYTETFKPAGGVERENQRRVLLNVHGGGFIEGARIASHFESVPIAAVAGVPVVSVDYRQAPEQVYPAATEDALAVYRELLKSYPPQNIGIYGCSAGGLLTAELTARLVKEHLPLPGAIALLCEGAGYWTEGDSGSLKVMMGGPIWSGIRDNPYFKNVDPDDGLAFPVRSPELLAKFPPTLLIASTRDPALSSVVHTHNLLVKLGVEADLHVWEGLEHGFMYDPELPPAREVYAVTAKFFDKHLQH